MVSVHIIMCVHLLTSHYIHLFDDKFIFKDSVGTHLPQMSSSHRKWGFFTIDAVLNHSMSTCEIKRSSITKMKQSEWALILYS